LAMFDHFALGPCAEDHLAWRFRRY
jgi:hypothetical protein